MSVFDWLSRRPRVGDAAWALLVSPVLLVGADADRTSSLRGAPAFVLSVIALLTMVWRRAHPDVLAAVAVVIHLVLLVTTDHITALNIMVPFVLYAVAAYSTKRWYRAWLVIAILGSVAAGLRWGTIPQGGELYVEVAATTVFCLAVVAASWVAGELARAKRRNIEALRQRADALERERDQRARLVAQEERGRIAREMHDIVAHNLSVIVVQAEGARYAATHAPDPQRRAEVASTALGTIAETAREALAQTRRLVGVLRDDNATADYAPTATLAQIPDLVAKMNGAGLPTTYDETGSPSDHGTLTPDAEMAAYRVVQESLTNAVKHAGLGARVGVVLDHRPDGVAVSIRDTGRGSHGAANDGAGHGVIGMRERIAACGGTLLARDRMSGGFEVLATIPAVLPPKRDKENSDDD